MENKIRFIVGKLADDCETKILTDTEVVEYKGAPYAEKVMNKIRRLRGSDKWVRAEILQDDGWVLLDLNDLVWDRGVA